MPQHLTRIFAGLAAAALAAGVLGVVTVSPPAALAADTGTAPTVRTGSLDVVGWDDQLVGDARPQLSWVIEDPDRAERQTAYQIEVLSSGDDVVWDSGEVTDTASTLRQYDGPALASGASYTWRVRVWDTDDILSSWSDPAHLHTGLLTFDDWDSSWLSVPDRQRTRVEFAVDAPVTSAFLYVAAQGGYQARLNGERVSDEELGSTWTDFGQRTLYRGVDVTDLLITGDNALGVTVGADQTNEGASTIDVMAQLELVAADGSRTTLVSTGPGWRTGPSPITRLDPYRGESADGRVESPGWDEAGFDDAAWSDTDVVGPVVGAPQLSTASGAVASAKDDVGCCGWSAVALNDGVLTSSAAKDHPQGYHSTTSSSATTEKWAQIDLGDSRAVGSVGLYPVNPTNDPTSGYAGMGFPIRYRVETSNDPTFATAELVADRTGEDQPNPGTSPVVLPVSATGRYVRVTATKLRQTNATFDFRLAELLVRGTSDDTGWGVTALEPDPTPPMRVVQSVDPVQVTDPASGVRVYDFGQNFAGWVQISAAAPRGTEARVYLGEVVTSGGRVTTANLDFGSGEPPRQDYRYTFAGSGQETWEPQFTYSGFRYAEVSGLPAGTAVTVRARVVHTDLEKQSSLETGDQTLQGISTAVERSQLNTVHGVPEDTPTREKKGWTGDALSGVSSIMAAFDADTFYRKYLRDIQTSLYANGGVPSVTPSRGFGATYKVDPAWGAAYPVIVWTHYLDEGDPSLLAENYDDLAGWVDYLGTVADADHVVVRPETSWGNDWLSVQETPPALFHTGYYLRSVQILADVARALGRDADAQRYDELAAAIGAGINKRFLNRGTASYSNGSQFANAFPLLLGVVPDDLESRVLGTLVADIRGRGNHLSSGFVGTQPIIQALHADGRDDVVLDVAERDDFPSLGFMVKNGPGTIWETWDKRESPTGSSSKDHPALGGGMEEWFYQGLAGIEALEPGFHKISLTVPDLPGHDHAAASVETPLGTVNSDWTRSGADLDYQVEVPVGATADVVLPTDTRYAVSEGGLLLDGLDGVLDVASGDGSVTVTVGSGKYDFTVTAANAPVGAVVDDLVALQDHVQDLADGGDLAGDDRDQIYDAVDGIRGDLGAALLGGLDDDVAAVAASLTSALGAVQDLRAWLRDSGVDGPVRSELDGRLAAVQNRLVRALTASLGISVALPPVSGVVLPGGTVAGSVEVTNGGAGPITGLTASVSVDGWGTATAGRATLSVGESAQLPVTLTVPKSEVPGGFDADLSLTFTVAGQQLTLTDSTSDWSTVTSGLQVGAVTAVSDGGDPSDHAIVTVPVRNTGTADVRAHVALSLPDGWRSVTSGDVVLPAGDEVAVEVPVVMPRDRAGGAAVSISVDLRRGAASLATADASLTFDLARPPVGSVVDHVDFGDNTSETAHAVQASSSSGTGTEAGLTRRYSNSGTPGSWFSAEVTVPAGQPFVLRNVDTYFTPTTKKYNVLVDGVLVQAHLLPRAEPGAGFQVFDVLVDDSEVLDNDGSVRVRFEYPLGTSTDQGFFDPSIADTYVLAVPADTRAPDVAAVVAAGTPAEHGWFRSDVSVAVSAADNRDDAPAIETGDGATWQAYVGPVPVTGDGKHELSYRASDVAGNVSATRTLPVWIDTTAPATVLTATRGAGVEGADSAALSFTATDTVSGVAQTVYRIDGGAWATVGAGPITVQGFGQHLVDFASTDVAGNPEMVRQQTVDLADVDAVQAMVAPQVTGVAKYGAVLTATSGSWNTKGLTYGYQWLRDGNAISGATGTSYRVAASDVGKRLSVRVTATKAGKAPGTAVSTATGTVAKAVSSTKVGVSKTKVKKGKPFRVSVTVGSSPRATGRVVVRVDGKTVRTVTLKNGKATVKVVVKRKGKHKVTAVYAGSSVVAGSKSAARTVRIT